MILLSLIVSLLFSLTLFFFFNDTATTEIYTLSLHDALPISNGRARSRRWHRTSACQPACETDRDQPAGLAPERIARYFPARRSEEHTSELQSRLHLVCRLLLEKKKKKNNTTQRDQQSQHYRT